MGTKRTEKALLEVIPPRICITFRRGSFWSRPKNSKSRLWDGWVENAINTEPGSHDNVSEKVENHENRSELDPDSTNRAENQGFWMYKVLPIQWDPSRPPKLAYKIQNRPKITGHHRQKCTLNYSVNRMSGMPAHGQGIRPRYGCKCNMSDPGFTTIKKNDSQELRCREMDIRLTE